MWSRQSEEGRMGGDEGREVNKAKYVGPWGENFDFYSE